MILWRSLYHDEVSFGAGSRKNYHLTTSAFGEMYICFLFIRVRRAFDPNVLYILYCLRNIYAPFSKWGVGFGTNELFYGSAAKLEQTI